MTENISTMKSFRQKRHSPRETSFDPVLFLLLLLFSFSSLPPLHLLLQALTLPDPPLQTCQPRPLPHSTQKLDEPVLRPQHPPAGAEADIHRPEHEALQLRDPLPPLPHPHLLSDDTGPAEPDVHRAVRGDQPDRARHSHAPDQHRLRRGELPHRRA